MRKWLHAAILLLLALSAVAQDPPALLVSPSNATLLVGESHTFRAVGKDGRIQHDVRWSISPDHAARLTQNGDEVTVEAQESSGTVILTANAGGNSAEAAIEIRASAQLTPGTVMWSVSHLPGCKTTQITQAVPTANGPDLYVQETCADGTYIRAMTADGREMWRRKMGQGTPRSPALESKPAEQHHLNLNARSLCDSISPGLTKDAVLKLVQDRSLRLDQKEQESSTWTLEEQGFRCQIRFDPSGAVSKKKKTILSD